MFKSLSTTPNPCDNLYVKPFADGIDVERVTNLQRFTDILDTNDLNCQLCCKISKNQVTCANCTACFCSNCVVHWQSMNRDSGCPCPNGCQGQILPTAKMIRAIFSKLEVKCRYSNNNCDKVVPYDQLQAHEESCECQTTKCDTCHKPVMIKNMDSHKEQCPMSIVLCQACNSKMTLEKYQATHAKPECFECLSLQFSTNKAESDHKLQTLEAKLKIMIGMHQDSEKKVHTLEERLAKAELAIQKLLMSNLPPGLDNHNQKHIKKQPILSQPSASMASSNKQQWSWSLSKKSSSLNVSSDGKSVRKTDNKNGYTGLFGDVIFTKGKYEWEIRVESGREDHSWIWFGIMTPDKVQNFNQFKPQSGYGITSDGQATNMTRSFNKERLPLLDNTTITMRLNSNEGTFKILHKGIELFKSNEGSLKIKDFVPFAVLYYANNAVYLN